MPAGLELAGESNGCSDVGQLSFHESWFVFIRAVCIVPTSRQLTKDLTIATVKPRSRR